VCNRYVAKDIESEKLSNAPLNTHTSDSCTMAEQPGLNHMESQVSVSVELNPQDGQNDSLREETDSSELMQQSKVEIEQQMETNGYPHEDETEQNGDDTQQQEIEDLQYMLEMKDNELQEQQEKN